MEETILKARHKSQFTNGAKVAKKGWTAVKQREIRAIHYDDSKSSKRPVNGLKKDRIDHTESGNRGNQSELHSLMTA